MKALIFVALAASVIACQKAEDKSKPKPAMENSALQLSPQGDFSGVYKVINDSSDTGACNIAIRLKQEVTGYTYQLVTDSRNIKGKASFQQENEGALLTLEGIKWDEYEGDVSNEDKAPKDELKLPEGVAIQVKNDTISIQNSGNAMNSYTIFGECGKKFIRLAKQKTGK